MMMDLDGCGRDGKGLQAKGGGRRRVQHTRQARARRLGAGDGLALRECLSVPFRKGVWFEASQSPLKKGLFARGCAREPGHTEEVPRERTPANGWPGGSAFDITSEFAARPPGLWCAGVCVCVVLSGHGVSRGRGGSRRVETPPNTKSSRSLLDPFRSVGMDNHLDQVPSSPTLISWDSLLADCPPREIPLLLPPSLNFPLISPDLLPSR